MIEPHAKGCVLKIRAQPGARRAGVVGVHAGMLKVAVTAPADRGRANDAIADVLAEAIGVKRSQVELISGPTHREKKFLIRGAQSVEIERKVHRLLAPDSRMPPGTPAEI